MELVTLWHDFRWLDLFVRSNARADKHLAVIDGYVKRIAILDANDSHVLSLLLADSFNDVKVHDLPTCLFVQQPHIAMLLLDGGNVTAAAISGKSMIAAA